MGIHAIDGMAGVGKTALAVHAAHEIAQHFPDGQLFVRLHAHTPGQRPVDPAEALATLLLARGVAPQQIPAGLAARELLWRDRVADQKLLLVLDDATGAGQVESLLPGGSGSLVLITSRRRLGGLDDAVSISLDILAPGEAAELFCRVAARPDLAPTDTAVAEVSRLCGYLPLAIRLMAGRLHHRTWTATDLAAELATARDRLGMMDDGARSVTAAFDLSYQDLSADQQQVFRRLGLHPGPEIDAYATAALTDATVPAARRHLEDLCDLHLLDEPVRGRYRLHDLLADYARTLAATDPAPERDTAVHRLLDYYLHTARHLTRRTRTPGAPLTHPPHTIPDLATCDAALGWLEAERATLHAATDHAATHHQATHAIELPAAMHDFLRAQGHWDQARTLHHTALHTVHTTGNRLGEANALKNLGIVQRLTGDFPAAADSLRQALALSRDLDNRHGKASALTNLGTVQYLTGDYPAATATLEQALTLFRDLGNRHGEATALTNLGVAQYLTGDYPAATATLEQALVLFRDVGDRDGEAETLNNLGQLLLASSAPAQARAHYQHALDIARTLQTPLQEARAREGLGHCHLHQGQTNDGLACLHQALTLYQRLGTPDAQRVQTTLHTHQPPRP